MVLRKAIPFLISVSLLLMSSSCEAPEIPPTLKIGSGPSFFFHGSERLVTFAVYAPPTGQRIASPFNIMWMVPDPDIAPAIWQLECPNRFLGRIRVEGLVIPYGKVPSGCLQAAPQQPQSFPPLTGGVIYSFSGETFYGRSTAFTNGYFYVDGSGAIHPVDVPDLCLTRKVDHLVRVNCKTSEPYREPTDIEKFVQEHRKSQ